jgi:hypothetical protein
MNDASAQTGWRKNGDCLEVVDGQGAVLVRAEWLAQVHVQRTGPGRLHRGSRQLPRCGSRPRLKDPNGPAQVIAAVGWSSFVDAVKGGEFPSEPEAHPERVASVVCDRGRCHISRHAVICRCLRLTVAGRSAKTARI